MPKRPKIKNVRWHGGKDGQFVFRAKVGDQIVAKSLGQDAVEARRQAFLLRQEIEVKRLSGKPLPGTVAEFSQTWLENYVQGHRTKNLKKAEDLATYRLRKHILPVLGNLRLSDVRRSHLEELAMALRRKGLAVNTQRHILSDARCLFSYAVEIEVIETNPFSGKKVLPQAPEPEPDPLSDIELATILRLLPEPYHSAVLLAAHTGMRWGEQRGLRWEDVELGGKPSLFLRKTKNGRWRRIPLDSVSIGILTRWRKESRSEYVVPWRPKDATWAYRQTKERQKEAGVTVISWCWKRLRDTFACDYLNTPGASIEVLSRLLGHSSVTVTERHYGRLSESSVRAEFERVRGGEPEKLAISLATGR